MTNLYTLNILDPAGFVVAVIGVHSTTAGAHAFDRSPFNEPGYSYRVYDCYGNVLEEKVAKWHTLRV